jgi:hypothetical protein
LTLARSTELAILNRLLAAMSKSFLILFFKKEVLSSLVSNAQPAHDVHTIELPLDQQGL